MMHVDLANNLLPKAFHKHFNNSDLRHSIRFHPALARPLHAPEDLGRHACSEPARPGEPDFFYARDTKVGLGS